MRCGTQQRRATRIRARYYDTSWRGSWALGLALVLARSIDELLYTFGLGAGQGLQLHLKQFVERRIGGLHVLALLLPTFIIAMKRARAARASRQGVLRVLPRHLTQNRHGLLVARLRRWGRGWGIINLLGEGIDTAHTPRRDAEAGVLRRGQLLRNRGGRQRGHTAS